MSLTHSSSGGFLPHSFNICSQLAWLLLVPTVEKLVSMKVLDKYLLNGLQAEVLSQVRQKTRYSAQDGFACLVAEDARDPKGIVGVVEVGIQAGKVNSSNPISSIAQAKIGHKRFQWCPAGLCAALLKMVPISAAIYSRL